LVGAAHCAEPGKSQEVLMKERIPSDDAIQKFIDASDDLMKLGIGFSNNVGSAFLEFREHLNMVMKTHFVEKAVVEMLSDSFARMESKVQTNMESIVKIYQEGGYWYSFYLGRALKRHVDVPSVWRRQELDSVERAKENQ
jgi:hypothetical protein